VLPALVLGAAGFVGWLLARVRDRLPPDRRPVGVALTAVVAVAGLAVAVLPILPMIADNPRDHAWNAMRAYLHEHDAAVDTIVTDDRDSLVLGIYSREPVGGRLVVHAQVDKLGHALKAPPVATGGPGTYLIWTPGLSHKKPKAFDGWHLLLKERELRLYGPAAG
jgi:hypothetical protein